MTSVVPPGGIDKVRRLAAEVTRRLVQLFTGLALYGVSLAFLLRAGLGLAPWDVLHQGLAEPVSYTHLTLPTN